MSAIASPLSATAPFTASSAWAARGISAERVTLEKPTPLTATLQRFSHMPLSLFSRRRIGQTKLRQRDISVERFEDDLDPTSDLRLRIGRAEKIAGEQGAGRLVEFHDDAGVGDSGGKAFVAGVVHDGVGVDGAGAAHGLELQIYAHALDAGRIRRMLEM